MNRSVILFLALLLAGAIILSCGGSHTLQSITLSPQVTNANGSAVQFVAT